MSKNYKEFANFIIVGVITFVIDYSLLYFLTESLHFQYLLSSGMSFVISVIINYFLCLKFVFHGARNGWCQAILFILSSIGGLILNQWSMSFLVETVGLYYMFAKLVATGFVMVWNFITKKMALLV